MNSNQIDSIASVIVAGGKSSRFNSSREAVSELSIHKGLEKLGKYSLIEHVYRRLAAQTAKVWINIPDQYSLSFDEPIDAKPIDRINDVNDQQNGPLLGVLTALRQSVSNSFEWLLISPCDTPFLPADLAARLLQSCNEFDYPLAIPRSLGRLQPSHSLWHKSLLPLLETAVITESKSGFKQFYMDIPHCIVDWAVNSKAGTDDPFFNINYQQDFETATDIMNNHGDC